MGDYMVIGIVLVFVVLMSILPKPVYNAITRAFSMHKNRIHRILLYCTFFFFFCNQFRSIVRQPIPLEI